MHNTTKNKNTYKRKSEIKGERRKINKFYIAIVNKTILSTVKNSGRIRHVMNKTIIIISTICILIV